MCQGPNRQAPHNVLQSPAYDAPITPATHPVPPPPKPRSTFVGMLLNIYALMAGLIILLNFTSSAIIGGTAWLLFHRLCPPIYYFTRVWVVRWGWLAAVVFQRIANVTPMATGDSHMLGRSDYFPLDPRRYWDMFSRKVPQAFCFMNHLSWADSFVMASWLLPKNGGNGDTCWPIWKAFISTPLGWTAYIGGCPFLGYGREKDLKKVEKSATNFFNRHFSKYYIFPEGAIYRPEMKKKSLDYAAKNNLPVLEHCLHPKTAAFHLAGSLLREQGMKELLCITLAYGKDTQLDKDPYDLLELVRPHWEPVTVHFHVRRLSIEDVDWGNGEEGVRDWLVQRFKEKDDLLNQLYQGTGPMTHEPRVERPSVLLLVQEVLLWLSVQAVFYGSLFTMGAQCARWA